MPDNRKGRAPDVAPDPDGEAAPDAASAEAAPAPVAADPAPVDPAPVDPNAKTHGVALRNFTILHAGHLLTFRRDDDVIADAALRVTIERAGAPVRWNT